MEKTKHPLIGITVSIEDGRHIVKRQYAEAVAGLGVLPFLIPPCGSPTAYAQHIDGLIISGGDDIDPSYYDEEPLFDMTIEPKERTDFEIRLIREIMRLRKPVLGICYGMQLINVMMGGTLYQDTRSQGASIIDHKVSPHKIEVKDNIFVNDGIYTVGSTHHQAVKIISDRLKVFIYSEDGLVEGYYMEGYPFLMGLQWHPERGREDGISMGLINKFLEAAGAKK